jgi:AraC-like DNA-binding protein/mannose-6-phosphate isomerase-like protein (cupin superfamily)
MMSKKRQTRIRGTKMPEDGILIRSLAIKHSRPQRIAEHAHDWHQLIYASEGMLWVHTQEGEWVVPANRAVWVPAGVSHSIELTGTAYIKTLYVHPQAKARLPSSCCAVNVSSLLRELILHIINIGPLSRQKPSQARLIAFLLDQLGSLPSIALQLPAVADERASEAVQWMRLHPDDHCSIKVLARRVGVSVRTLERAFLDDTGITLGQWRMQLRFLQALRWMAERKSITEVALAVGYDSTSAFISAFKRHFGVTPGRYFR